MKRLVGPLLIKQNECTLVIRDEKQIEESRIRCNSGIFIFLTGCLGPKQQDFLSKINICTRKKPLYFVNSIADSSSKSAKF